MILDFIIEELFIFYLQKNFHTAVLQVNIILVTLAYFIFYLSCDSAEPLTVLTS